MFNEHFFLSILSSSAICLISPLVLGSSPETGWGTAIVLIKVQHNFSVIPGYSFGSSSAKFWRKWEYLRDGMGWERMVDQHLFCAFQLRNVPEPPISSFNRALRIRAAQKALGECRTGAELVLTVRWGGRSSWTWSLVRGHSRCRICRGTTPGAGCGPGTSCAGRVPRRSWPAGPAGCAPAMGHSPHRSCERSTH